MILGNIEHKILNIHAKENEEKKINNTGQVLLIVLYFEQQRFFYRLIKYLSGNQQ